MNNKRIFHRDLHSGNVMIDEETGSPRVIDFGHSSTDGEDTVEEYMRGNITYKRTFKKDMDCIDTLEKELSKYLTKVQ